MPSRNYETEIDRRLAEILHENFCHREHMDDCNWGYEYGYQGDTWNYPEHKEWFKKAEVLIDLFYSSDIDDANAVSKEDLGIIAGLIAEALRT